MLTLGWVGAAVGLYAALVVLEYYWNAWEWQPDWDLIAWTLVVSALGCLFAMRLLASAARDLLSRSVSLILCLALLVLGCYVLAPEPLTGGVLGREHSSPAWYRFGRLALLELPSIIWVRGAWLGKKRDGQPCSRQGGDSKTGVSGSGST
jgi:hypothetical protein